MSLRFAMVADTHVGLVPLAPLAPASAERLGRVYAAVGRLAPDFVLHCGDITDTGLPGEYELYQQTVPATLRGRIRHVPGNHDVRWDPTVKGLYQAHFGPAPYSFDAGGVHFIGFDPTQPLLEPGHCGTAGLEWLARDLGRLAAGTPTLLFQHFPVGGDHDYVDDQAALLELIGIFTSRRLARHGYDLGFHVPCMSATWLGGVCCWIVPLVMEHRRVGRYGVGACSVSWASSWAMRRSAKRTLERAACSRSSRVRLSVVSWRMRCLSVVFSAVIR